MRIAVVTPIPTPYRDPFWESFSREQNVELSVIYCAAGKADRPWAESEQPWSYKRLFPKGRNVAKWLGPGRSCYWNPSIKNLLGELRPEIVFVGGYNHLTMLAAVRFCRKNGIPWLLMSESWKARRGLLRQVKYCWLRSWLQSAAGGLPTGKLASENLVRLGINIDRQCLVPNVPDIIEIRERANQIRQDLSEHRAALGLEPGGQVIVFAARMIPKKQPLLLIEAFAGLQHHSDARLVMIGDGPLRSQCESRVRELGCGDRVIFAGFIEPVAVQRWMAVADLFVQPSSETWGVAPIEALASGAPVILTAEVGAHPDLIGESSGAGIVIPTPSLTELRDALNTGLQQLSESSVRSDPHLACWLENNNYADIGQRLVEFCQRL